MIMKIRKKSNSVRQKIRTVKILKNLYVPQIRGSLILMCRRFMDSPHRSKKSESLHSGMHSNNYLRYGYKCSVSHVLRNAILK